MGRKIDASVVGKKFNDLIITGLLPSRRVGKVMRAYVMARCVCGTEKAFAWGNVKYGQSKGCGCKKYSGLRAHVVEKSTPQKWTIAEDEANLSIGATKIVISSGDLHLVEKYKWWISSTGYAYSRKGYMHRLILGLRKGDQRCSDHINHLTCDNRRQNLRIATNSQNHMNQRKQIRAAGKYKGVSFVKGKFVASIRIENKINHLGRFSREEDAALAYNFAAVKLFGPFALLNKPEGCPRAVFISSP